MKENFYSVHNTIDDILLEKSPFMKSDELCCSSSSVDSEGQVKNINEAMEMFSARLLDQSKSIDVNPGSVFTDLMAYTNLVILIRSIAFK